MITAFETPPRAGSAAPIVLACGAILVTVLASGCGLTASRCEESVRRAQADAMEQVCIPAGRFLMGSTTEDALSEQDETPQRSIHLDAFWIDRTEVTNRQYRLCVEAGSCPPPLHSTRYERAELAEHPVVGVTWFEAGVYCSWAVRRLPTEAEWEKAARGVDGRIYPWGHEVPSESLANFDQRFGETTPVGSFPDGASPYGVLDMAGNAWEWVADTYDPLYYSVSPLENPSGPPESVNWRVVRGGAWNTGSRALRSANRFWSFPRRDYFDGFRCAADF